VGFLNAFEKQENLYEESENVCRFFHSIRCIRQGVQPYMGLGPRSVAPSSYGFSVCFLFFMSTF
jgi:hypothetical protein